MDSIKDFLNDNKADVFSILGIEDGKNIKLSDVLGKLNIDSQTVSDLSNKFKDNAAQLVESMKNPQELRKLLENAGIDGEEINQVVSNFEVGHETQGNNSSGRAQLTFGLIVAAFVIFQM